MSFTSSSIIPILSLFTKFSSSHHPLCLSKYIYIYNFVTKFQLIHVEKGIIKFFHLISFLSIYIFFLFHSYLLLMLWNLWSTNFVGFHSCYFIFLMKPDSDSTRQVVIWVFSYNCVTHISIWKQCVKPFYFVWKSCSKCASSYYWSYF